jgi:phenylacetyl-CoA:acceptor oxidoreductase 26-kDa subunit
LLLAGLAALATGWQFKVALITRAAYNQGFALPHLPVRGTR